jgi:hypothetical protein
MQKDIESSGIKDHEDLSPLIEKMKTYLSEELLTTNFSNILDRCDSIKCK